MSQTSDVTQFMVAAGQPVRTSPQKVTKEEAILRVRLLMEEVLELAEAAGVDVSTTLTKAQLNELALEDGDELTISLTMPSLDFISLGDQDLVEIADALTDIQYVNVGAAITWGIPLDYCFELVQESNMSKFIDGHRDEATGKWIKGPSYKPVDLSFIGKPQAHLEISQAFLDRKRAELEALRNKEVPRADCQVDVNPCDIGGFGVARKLDLTAEVLKAADDGVSYEK